MTRFITLACALLLTVFLTPASIMAQWCQTSNGPDVIVGTLGTHPAGEPSVTNFTSVGGIEAFSLETTSCNIGTVNVSWLQSPNTNHPVIAQNCFRLKRVNGYNRFEQVGQSWLKHGFFAESE